MDLPIGSTRADAGVSLSAMDIPRLEHSEEERRGGGVPLPGIRAAAAKPGWLRALAALRWRPAAGLAAAAGIGFSAATLIALRDLPGSRELAGARPVAAGGVSTSVHAKRPGSSRSLGYAAYTGRKEGLDRGDGATAAPDAAGQAEAEAAHAALEQAAAAAEEGAHAEADAAQGGADAVGAGDAGPGGFAGLSSSAGDFVSGARLGAASEGGRGAAAARGLEGAGRLTAFAKGPGRLERQAAGASKRAGASRDMRFRGSQVNNALGQLRGMKTGVAAAQAGGPTAAEANAAAAGQMFEGRGPLGALAGASNLPSTGATGTVDPKDTKEVWTCPDGTFFDGSSCTGEAPGATRDVSPWAAKAALAWILADEGVRDVGKAVVSYASVVGAAWAWVFQWRAWDKARELDRLAAEIEAAGGKETADQVRRAAKDIRWAALAALSPLLGVLLLLRLRTSLKAGRAEAEAMYAQHQAWQQEQIAHGDRVAASEAEAQRQREAAALEEARRRRGGGGLLGI